jgi:hypothetical protein
VKTALRDVLPLRMGKKQPVEGVDVGAVVVGAV